MSYIYSFLSCRYSTMHSLTIAIAQWFSIPVLAPLRSAYFACLSLLTHLIQKISLLEVCSMHELCSDWHAPYTGSIAPYSLSRGNPLKFTLFRNIHSWICAVRRLHARMSVTSYTYVNIYNFNSRLAHFNALWMEYIRSLRTGIMEEYPVMSTSQGTCVRIEQTSEAIRVTYEICRAGGHEDWNIAQVPCVYRYCLLRGKTGCPVGHNNNFASYLILKSAHLLVTWCYFDPYRGRWVERCPIECLIDKLKYP